MMAAAHEDPWGESAEGVMPRCRRCKQIHVPPRPDPCLGVLEGVRAAECGHGRDDHAFVVLDQDDGTERTLYAEEALDYSAPAASVRLVMSRNERETRYEGTAAVGLVSRFELCPVSFAGDLERAAVPAGEILRPVPPSELERALRRRRPVESSPVAGREGSTGAGLRNRQRDWREPMEIERRYHVDAAAKARTLVPALVRVGIASYGS